MSENKTSNLMEAFAGGLRPTKSWLMPRKRKRRKAMPPNCSGPLPMPKSPRLRQLEVAESAYC